MKLNGMKKSVIFPGQSLIVAGSGPSTKPSARKTTSAKATAKKKSAKSAGRKRSSR
jgi:hypothetical protein